MAELDPISAAFVAVEQRLRLYFLQRVWDFAIVADPMSLEEFKAVTRKTPLLALGWRQFNPNDQRVGRRFQGELGLRLTIVVKHPLDAGKRFLGDRAGFGLFPAVSAAVALLNGHTKEGVGTFSVTAIAQAYAEGFSDHNVAIATLDIGVLVSIGDVTGALADAPEFLRALADFGLPGEPGTPEEPGEPFTVRTS